jgi:hypothetical protein
MCFPQELTLNKLISEGEVEINVKKGCRGRISGEEVILL